MKDPGEGKRRDELVQFLTRFCTWESSNDVKMVQHARELVLEGNMQRPPKVLDCFAGGGAIPLEALRAGCDTYALELNPVAVLLEICTLLYPRRYGRPHEISVKHEAREDGQTKRTISVEVVPNRLAHDVDTWGRRVLEETRKEIGEFYPKDEDNSVPVAYLWARTVRCPNPKCEATVPLIRQLWLAKKGNKKVALRMLPDNPRKRVRLQVVQGNDIDFDPENGTMKKGTVRCPFCGQATKGEYLRDEAMRGRMGQQLMAVVLSSESDTGKSYREPTPLDNANYERAERLLATSRKALGRIGGIPDEQIPIPKVPSTSEELGPFFVHLQVVNYGLKTFGQLFNARQALALATFATKVREAHAAILGQYRDEEYAKAVTTYLGLAVDRLANQFCSLARWNNVGEKIEGAFSRQALQMVWDYVEGNPLSGLTGGFSNALDWILRVIEHCSLVGLNSDCYVSQGTATSLPYDDAFFDAIVTDPPYYDAVPYSDLSDFFYVWLKRTVGPLYPNLFATPLTPKGPEIIQDSSLLRRAAGDSLGRTKDKAFFETRMAEVFHEMHRVLKPGGTCTVVFAHKTTTAWETLITALLKAGFAVSASWPLHTEMGARLRAQESAALASSVWLICRKRETSAPNGSWKQVQSELEVRVKERMDFFLSQGIRGADALLSAIGPALEVFGRYSKVQRVTGEDVTIGEFLDKVTEVVSRHALASVLEGREMGAVDSPTAFYVLWKWSYEGREDAQAAQISVSEQSQKRAQSHAETGDPEQAERAKRPDIRIAVDDALKLARSVGAEFEELTRPGGILLKEKEFVELLGPEERRAVRELGEPARDGRQPALIDILHRALNHWAAGETPALEEFLDKSGARTTQELWSVASALSRILPIESPEKRLIDGLWARYGGGAASAGQENRDKTQTVLGQFMEKT